MKNWAVLIVLLITVAGTFVPCCQVDECAAEQATSSTHNGDEKEQGSCSPFFVCATCPTFAVLAKPIQLYQPVEEKITHYQKRIVFHLTGYSASFWQPPRFC